MYAVYRLGEGWTTPLFASADAPADVSGNVTMPSLQASGFIQGGQVVITVISETNVSAPILSTNITR